MKSEKKYTLFAIEAHLGEEKTCSPRQDYHSFLGLVDVTNTQAPKIVDEIHFTSAGKKIQFFNTILLGNPSSGEDPFKDCVLSGIVSGNAADISQVWDKAKQISAKLTELNIDFSRANTPEAVNCRAGVKAVIEALGFEYNPVLEHVAREGTSSNLSSLIEHNHHNLVP